MTVVTTLLTREHIAVGSDSLITRKIDNKLEVVEDKEPKFVFFKKLNCVACYWGLAQAYEGGTDKLAWSMHPWLEEQIPYSEKSSSIAQFGAQLAKELTGRLNYGSLKKVESKGLGIHLAGFENVKNLVIPELYLLSNYGLNKGVYSKSSDTINFSARTFHDFKHQIEKTIIKTTEDERFEMYKLLKIKEAFIFNNGDPIMFNSFAHGYINLFYHLKSRHALRPMTPIEELKELASFPIRTVKEFQERYYKSDQVVVGGDIHAAVISKTGQIS